MLLCGEYMGRVHKFDCGLLHSFRFRLLSASICFFLFLLMPFFFWGSTWSVGCCGSLGLKQKVSAQSRSSLALAFHATVAGKVHEICVVARAFVESIN